MYNLELDKAVQEIKKQNAKLVLVQLPEGLKKEALQIKEKLKEHAEIIISGSPCWGACDLAEAEAKEIGANLILHFGHIEFKTSKIPTFYLPVYYQELFLNPTHRRNN